jgi:hypothetical protein
MSQCWGSRVVCEADVKTILKPLSSCGLDTRCWSWFLYLVLAGRHHSGAKGRRS